MGLASTPCLLINATHFSYGPTVRRNDVCFVRGGVNAQQVVTGVVYNSARTLNLFPDAVNIDQRFQRGVLGPRPSRGRASRGQIGSNRVSQPFSDLFKLLKSVTILTGTSFFSNQITLPKSTTYCFQANIENQVSLDAISSIGVSAERTTDGRWLPFCRNECIWPHYDLDL